MSQCHVASLLAILWIEAAKRFGDPSRSCFSHKTWRPAAHNTYSRYGTVPAPPWDMEGTYRCERTGSPWDPKPQCRYHIYLLSILLAYALGFGHVPQLGGFTR